MSFITDQRILLHICCAPCATYTRKALEEEGQEVMGFFYNPNIHPYTEYEKRLATLRSWADATGLPMIYKDSYDLEEFIRNAAFRETERCRFCYAMRLTEAARVAKHGGFPYYTTTLLISPFQRHDLIREMGEAIGERHGVRFYYRDFRPGFRESVRLSKELGLYRQQYCGCIYSEMERFMKRQRKGSQPGLEGKPEGSAEDNR